jgi:uncharacterized protein (DUF302 family)
MDHKGIITTLSPYSVKETLDRLQILLEHKGIRIFARIDQQAEARTAGLALTPLELLIFGNPKAGTPVMAAVPLAGLDLPLKALAWEDKEGKVWLSYNDPAYLQQRHGFPVELINNITPTAFITAAVQ